MKYRKALVVGGSNGVGLSVALSLVESCSEVVVLDKAAPDMPLPNTVVFVRHDLLADDFSSKAEEYGLLPNDVDVLVITAGFGRVAPFDTFLPKEIDNVYQVNAASVTKLLNYYFVRLKSSAPFYCCVMGSIAGLVASPLLSLYSASKAAVGKLIEGLNAELETTGSENRILTIQPGSIKGTKFYGASQNDLSLMQPLTSEIVRRMFARETSYIPDYETTYRAVLERYTTDPHQFALESYQYKMQSGRMNLAPQLKIGYLSGTFDLFHIGHLNLLQRAKSCCDYLVVGVHKDASHKGKETFIPFQERCDIVRNIKYVDRVIQSLPEDDEVYKQGIVKYDYLFVGSDYKGTERFNRYEDYFSDKGVKIIYFPYTHGTSSTKLREALDAIILRNSNQH